MKGYSKIKIFTRSARSRSMDLSDPLTSLEPKNANSHSDTDIKPQEKIASQLQSFKNLKNNNTSTKTTTTTTTDNSNNIKGLQDSVSWLQAEDDYKENSNAEIMFTTCKLKRNSSVSSVSSASALHSAVKNAFSMRRSSSVSERYCRIHDQSLALPSPTHDEDDGFPTRSVKRKKSRGRIIRACKKLIGL
ncbi:hypothetical protein P3X46_024550 [Hevea brasiliensis]|uniref:Uncharacterized protein n=1 Tax=Hevea brasiliensis TaxID=3981 RepID=A0ABQ9L2U4_HEVBR|nr:hypothetical protein P3X46_024550 [Hevea brasiliensis]